MVIMLKKKNYLQDLKKDIYILCCEDTKIIQIIRFLL